MRFYGNFLNKMIVRYLKDFLKLIDTEIDTKIDINFDTKIDTRFVIDFDIVKIYNVVKWSNYGRTKH